MVLKKRRLEVPVIVRDSGLKLGCVGSGLLGLLLSDARIDNIGHDDLYFDVQIILRLKYLEEIGQ